MYREGPSRRKKYLISAVFTLVVAGAWLRVMAIPAAGPADMPASVTLARRPLRSIHDPFPTYAAVAVDPLNKEIILQDENLFQIMVYDRLANTPIKATMTEPKRVISGPQTNVEFNCGLYVDPRTGDIYSINNDTLDSMVVFSRSAKGDVHPDRQLHTPHGTYGIAVNEQTQELFLTVQHDNSVVVYRKSAQGEEKPLRILEGPHTGLADPHGVAIDTKNKLLFVANQGSTKLKKTPGSGRFVPPSITVYSLDASGDTAPLRAIEGPNTQLDWPAHLYADEDHSELYVANDAGDSILIFHESDGGEASPARILKGPKTQIKNPTGVFVDTSNDELVVANMGNHRATVYHRSASGDTPPLRTIRSGPDGMPALQIGNPGAVAYDTKREQIIVPNCVAHAQIAIFARSAKGGDSPQRLIFGQPTKLSRTMHAISYSAKHDEFYVTNPFAQAILTFRGAANGQEAPVRIIQGPSTHLEDPDTLEIDEVHDEILVPQKEDILIFPLAASGDVAPLRIIHGGRKNGWTTASGGIAVDPIHNVVVAAGTILSDDNIWHSPYGNNRESLLIFDRLANGDAKPLRVIRGPQTGMHAIRQMQIQPKGGWIVITQMTSGEIPEPEGTYVGVFSINDSGDVPPRWKIDGKASNGMKKPHGIVLDAKNREVIVADMRMNAILTYSFPEIF